MDHQHFEDESNLDSKLLFLLDLLKENLLKNQDIFWLQNFVHFHARKNPLKNLLKSLSKAFMGKWMEEFFFHLHFRSRC